MRSGTAALTWFKLWDIAAPATLLVDWLFRKKAIRNRRRDYLSGAVIDNWFAANLTGTAHLAWVDGPKRKYRISENWP